MFDGDLVNVGRGAYLCFGMLGLLKLNLLSSSLRGVAPISVSGVPTLNVLISLRIFSTLPPGVLSGVDISFELTLGSIFAFDTWEGSRPFGICEGNLSPMVPGPVVRPFISEGGTEGGPFECTSCLEKAPEPVPDDAWP